MEREEDGRKEIRRKDKEEGPAMKKRRSVLGERRIMRGGSE